MIRKEIYIPIALTTPITATAISAVSTISSLNYAQNIINNYQTNKLSIEIK